MEIEYYETDYIFKSRESFCNPYSAEDLQQNLLLTHQRLLQDYIIKQDDNILQDSIDANDKNLFIYHGVGSGKTCTSIVIIETIREKYIKQGINVDIYYIGPSSIEQQFAVEYNKCMNRKHNGQISIEDNVSNKLFKTIDNKINQQKTLLQAFQEGTPLYFEIQKKIDDLQNQRLQINQKEYSRKHVQFFSHQKAFVTKGNTLYKCVSKSNNKVIIVVDEVQKILPHVDTGKMDKRARQVLNNIKNLQIEGTNEKKLLRVVFLSATPIVNYGISISKLIHLLNPDITVQDVPLNALSFYNRFTDVKDLKPYLKGHVSYLAGGHPNAFPMKRIIFMEHTMSEEQEHAYFKALKQHYRKTVRENEHVQEEQCHIIQRKCVLSDRSLVGLTENDPINLISPKIAFVMQSIKACKGPVFVYCTMITEVLRFIQHCFHINGFVEVTKQNVDNARYDNKRYMIWTGDSKKPEMSEFVRQYFNTNANKNGRIIKVIYGTSTVSEGVHFANIHQFHMLNMWWNKQSLRQVIGRCVRFKSHCNNLERKDEIPTVVIFLHVAVYRKVPIEQSFVPTNNIHSYLTIDQYILKKAVEKARDVLPYERILKQTAFDCNQNRKGNLVRLEEYIVPYSVSNRTEMRDAKIWRYYQNPSTLDKYILFYTTEQFEKTMSTCEQNENYRVQPFTNLQELGTSSGSHDIPITQKLPIGAIFLKCNVEQNRNLIYTDPKDESNKLIVVDDNSENNEINSVPNRITRSFIVYENEPCL